MQIMKDSAIQQAGQCSFHLHATPAAAGDSSHVV